MELLLTAIAGLLIIYLVFFFASRRANYWKDRGFPCMKSLPFVGNSWELLRARKTLGEVTQEQYDYFRGERFGGFVQLIKPVLLIREPELINQILIKDFTHFEDRGFLVDEDVEPINFNIANMTGEKWRSLRHKLTPTFTSGKLKSMFGQMVHVSDYVLDHIKEKGEPFDARAVMQKYNLSVTGSIAFGLDIDSCKDDDEMTKFLEYSRRFFSPNIKQLLKFLVKQNFPNLSNYFRMKMLDEDVTQFFTTLVTNTVEFRKSSGTRRNDFLQLLLDMQERELSGKPDSWHLSTSEKQDEEEEPEDRELLDQMKYATRDETQKPMRLFTDNAIIAQSFLFIAGGSETTAAALGFALYHLGANDRVQTTLQDEVDAVLNGQEFTYQAVKEMKYLGFFIDEALRLNPPGGVLQRECTKDYLIPGTDKVIEKGVIVTIPVSALHKDPQYYPDPENFEPERFRDRTQSKGVYLPFGDGPRSCIANRLALLQMKVFLARLIMKYTIRVHEKTQIPLKMAKNSIFQHVEGGIWVEMKGR